MDALLFVKTSSLGDVVHNMPAVTEARRRWPAAHIGWVVEEAFAPLARLHPGVDAVIPVATRRWRGAALSPSAWREVVAFRRGLRARGYDRVVDTQGLLRSALIAAQARGERHGYDRASIREPAAAWFYDVRHAVGRDQHAVLRNRALAGLALDFVPSDRIDYGLPPRPAPAAAPYAMLFHGTSRADKEWRESDWIGLGQALRRRGLGVVLPWGSEAERVRSERLAGAVPGAEVLPRRPLDETARVIAGAALVVGVDTGLLHLAAAYAVPLIGVFIATDPRLTGPVGPGPIEIVGGKGDYPGYARAVAAAERLQPA
ncbi:MAG: lipopolysaccharide heptosyltransferase I [Xanthobacteraceae bacterium]|nr:lipopolysaccharide heptosyltransferase I [Xanthobacteraceae bacterium]